jgi:hypothetical protein
MKVTDRRMFTADGELRTQYSHLGKAGPPAEADSEAPPAEALLPEEGTPAAAEGAAEPEEEGPSILDLMSLLAENASIHLQQAAAPGGGQAENLELAKLYVDLLAILKKKTAGNLTSNEEMVLDDVLYRLRLGFAERGGL